MGLRGEVGMLPAKIGRKMPKNGRGAVKNRHWGHPEAKTGRNGGQKLRNSRKTDENCEFDEWHEWGS